MGFFFKMILFKTKPTGLAFEILSYWYCDNNNNGNQSVGKAVGGGEIAYQKYATKRNK